MLAVRFLRLNPIDWGANLNNPGDLRTGALPETTAGFGHMIDYLDDKAAMATNFAAIAVDTAGNIYIADTGNQRVRRVMAATGVISTIAGFDATIELIVWLRHAAHWGSTEWVRGL